LELVKDIAHNIALIFLNRLNIPEIIRVAKVNYLIKNKTWKSINLILNS